MNALSISSRIGRTIQYAGNELLYFSGTAYLGMGSLPEFEEMVLSGLQQYGPNYGASRASNVQLEVYEEVESYFALQAEAEKSVLMSSGFMAGYVTANLLKGLSDESWIAPDTHPAILPEGLGPIPSHTFGQFKERCIALSHQVQGKVISIFANAVDPLMPAIHDFDWVKDLSKKNSYHLLLDDSHAFGVVGNGIFGTYSQWKDLPVHLLISGSLGKGLCIPAGIILGEASLIKKITSNPIYIGASPPAPAFCQAFLSAQNLYHHQQEKLQKNLEVFFSLVQRLDVLNFEESMPIATFNTSGWAKKLQKREVLISSFPYPTPMDASVERIILSAYHEPGDLEALYGRIEQINSSFPLSQKEH